MLALFKVLLLVYITMLQYCSLYYRHTQGTFTKDNTVYIFKKHDYSSVKVLCKEIIIKPIWKESSVSLHV